MEPEIGPFIQFLEKERNWPQSPLPHLIYIFLNLCKMFSGSLSSLWLNKWLYSVSVSRVEWVGERERERKREWRVDWMIKKILLCSEGWAPLLSQQRSAISYLGQNWPVRQLHWEREREIRIFNLSEKPSLLWAALADGGLRWETIAWYQRRGEERRSEVRWGEVGQRGERERL